MRFGSVFMAGIFPSLAVLGSCTIPIGGAEVGDLRVTWSFAAAAGDDASQRCADVGVDNVTIQLIEKGKEGAGAKAFGATGACIDGSMVLPDVLAGTYTLTATGDGEVAVFDNGEGLTVEVKANEESAVDAPLVLANGEVVSRVEFQYTFAGEARCSAAKVATINAQIIDDNGTPIAGSTSECIGGLAVVEGVRVGEHTLQVEAIDGDGNVRFFKEITIKALQAGKTVRPNRVDLDAALVDVVVNFGFEDQDSCAEAGVATVDVQLRDSDDNVIAGQNVACVGGSAVFPNMPLDVNRDGTIDETDVYTVKVDGIDGGGEVLFSKNEDGVTFSAEEPALAVTLDAVSSTVRVRFTFPAGLSCADLGQPNVDIQIVDSDGNATGTNVACIAGDSGPLIAAPGRASISIDAIVGDDVIFHGDDDNVGLAAGNNVEEINLVAVRSTLELSWDFSLVHGPTFRDDGTQAAGIAEPPTNSCIDADVDTVIVRIFRGGTLELAQSVDCDDGRVEMPGIAVGNITVQMEGIREQEGDAPFKLDDTVVVAGSRTAPPPFTLEPALVFALLVWAGDCGTAGAATVDVRVEAGVNGVNSGINLPCAQGSQTLALPAGSELSPITITLLGVDGQGVPDVAADLSTIGPVAVAPGISTFRFSGPD